MKKILSFMVILALAIGFVAAQGTTNGNPPSNAATLAPWVATKFPEPWKRWLESGGTLPGDLRDAILTQASDWGRQFGLDLAQMKQSYVEGKLTIQPMTADPAARTSSQLIFRVSYGGGSTIIVVIDPS
jgi:hypothetical protein